ncbi:MAG: M13 family metallopeptidase [Candidatus Thermoplasmatota archaeon]|nr:M13 family metallopeptidase [Candidatus Thermoplasmatota archaeon]
MDITQVRNRVERISNNERPEDPKFSVDFMDTSADPGTDFYRYCNGKWMDSHPIPQDKSQWSSFTELLERNRFILGKILEECAFGDHPDDLVKNQVGWFYLSSMDTETIERKRFEPIKDIMKIIQGISEKDEIIPAVSKLHRIGIPVMFSYSSYADEKKSSTYAYYLTQGGISLPNKDYYLKDSFENIRKDFKKHIANMFELYGKSRKEADADSEIVFDLELRMAESSRTPVELRDPERNYNRFELEGIDKRLGDINIKQYLSEISLPPVQHIVVKQPEFFENLSKMLIDIPLDSWKIYLMWQVLHFSAPFLHEEVANEDFDFFDRKMSGRPKQEKRWKRMVNLIDSEIGEALGRLYVERTFGEESKRRMEEMVNDLREVFTEKLEKLSWMSENTRAKALEKFSMFRAKIGYPTRFIDYSSITITPFDFLGNILRSNAFEFEREIKRIDSPVDRELWEMTPPTVNAYFDPTVNEIVFPAGILQPPYFDPELDDAVNYGATGGIIAHEITHGFDDEGRKYDKDGNLNDWWAPEDAGEFTKRAKSVVDLYSSQEALPGLRVNGELTLGENIADIGGISIAYDALERKLERNPSLRREIDGLTQEQRFYIGWSQAWRANIRDETTRLLISNDPHSPNKFRGEIPARVHYKFESHFKGTDGKKEQMSKVITIW